MCYKGWKFENMAREKEAILKEINTRGKSVRKKMRVVKCEAITSKIRKWI